MAGCSGSLQAGQPYLQLFIWEDQPVPALVAKVGEQGGDASNAQALHLQGTHTECRQDRKAGRPGRHAFKGLHIAGPRLMQAEGHMYSTSASL